MPDHRTEFLNGLRRHTAQAAIGASALRNQGAAGVVDTARDFAERIDLSLYGSASSEQVPKLLDRHTKALLKKFPEGANENWGAARKALNLFLRDATYNVDLSREYGLRKIRRYLEVPLDKDVATGLKEREKEGKSLPRWKGIKNLQGPTSDEFQSVAKKVAKRRKVDPVDLDVFYWRPKSDQKSKGRSAGSSRRKSGR